MPGLLVHCILEELKLYRGMYRSALSIQCILMEDGNNWATVSMDHPTYCTNADVT